MTPLRSGRLAVVLFAVALLGGCMMLPMHGAMLGMDGHGDDSSARTGGTDSGGQGHGGGDGTRESGASGGHGGSAHGSTAPVAAAIEHPLLARCESPLAVALVTDAASGSVAREAERFAVGVPSRIARALADASGCFRTLDLDPLPLAMPGGAQPDVILRVRVERLASPELSLAERAGRAGQGVKARHFGDKAAVDRLERVEVSLELVCARAKRLAAVFVGAADGALQDPPLLRELADAAGRENRERFAQAYARAQTAALAVLRSESRPCG